MKTCLTVSNRDDAGLNLNVARLALLNFLLSRPNDGRMVIRWDDYANSNSGTNPLYDNLNWLGVRNEEGPYFCRHFASEYEQAVEALIANGAAYLDFARPDELDQERRECKSKPYFYSRRWASADKHDAKAFRSEGRTSVVRLKMPRKQWMVSYRDMVKEQQQWELSQQPDQVIKRADGSFTEHLTTVIDYDRLDVTDVIADPNHFQLRPAQLFIQNELKLRHPTFYHIPFLTEPEGSRRFLPSRHERHMHHTMYADLYRQCFKIATICNDSTDIKMFHPSQVQFYRKSGFHPWAVGHYLVASAMPLESGLRSPQPQLLSTYQAEVAKKRFATKAESFNPVQLLRLQQAFMRCMALNQKSWMVNEVLRRANLGSYQSFAAPFSGNKLEVAPKPLTETVKGLGDKLVLAGDILFYTDQVTPELHNHLCRKPNAADQSLLERIDETLIELEEELAEAEDEIAAKVRQYQATTDQVNATADISEDNMVAEGCPNV